MIATNYEGNHFITDVAVGICINNTVYATTDISANVLQSDNNPVRFDLVKVESDFVSINQSIIIFYFILVENVNVLLNQMDNQHHLRGVNKCRYQQN